MEHIGYLYIFDHRYIELVHELMILSNLRVVIASTIPLFVCLRNYIHT